MKKKDSSQQKITHLVYSITSVADVLHRFSPQGYEMLTDKFMGNQETIRMDVDPSAPILMEITGKCLTEQEQASIRHTVMIHYGLKLSEVNRILKDCRIKLFWFLISFLLSSLLLFLTNNRTQEVIVQYAYLPFWFFGYRLLTYPIFDYIPMCRERKWIENLASMHLYFSESPIGIIPDTMRPEILSGTEIRLNMVRKQIRKNALVREYFLEDGVITLECNVSTEEDILTGSGINGTPLISEELALYLEQAVPFIGRGHAIRLKISGAIFSGKQKKQILKGLQNYFALRLKGTESEVGENIRRILLFGAGLIIASIILYVHGGEAGVAYHEWMLIMLWFFGDYLIEYILLTQRELENAKRKWKAISGMDILVSSE